MDFIKDILKGMIIGIANVIPGVSGGTMMVSMGIYDNIINSITHLFKDFKKSIKTLLPYGIGMVIGIVGLAFVIVFLFKRFELQTKLAFIGLIIGGVPIIWEKIKGKEKKKGPGHILIFLLLFCAIIAMEVFGGAGKEVSLKVNAFQLIMLFVIGVIASATMVIPGVSGSMMLMILGYYNPVLGLVKDFVSGAAHGDFQLASRCIIFIIPFGLGVVVGIFAVAKAIELLLSKYETYTYCGILGLVASSPVVILMGTSASAINPLSIIGGVIALAGGTLFAYKLSK